MASLHYDLDCSVYDVAKNSLKFQQEIGTLKLKIIIVKILVA